MSGKRAKSARIKAWKIISSGEASPSNEYKLLKSGQIINPRRLFYRRIKKEF